MPEKAKKAEKVEEEKAWYEALYDWAAEQLEAAWEFTKRTANAVYEWACGAGASVKSAVVASYNFVKSVALDSIKIVKNGAVRVGEAAMKAGTAIKKGAKKTVDYAAAGVTAAKDGVVYVGKKVWEFACAIGRSIRDGWTRGYDALFAEAKPATAKS